MRTAELKRDTKETKIYAKLNVDGTGISDVDTGCGFLDHMLTLFAKHGRFDLYVRCDGDINVDYHHTVEDVGIVLGKLFKECLGDLKGVTRYGFFILPMDESLILTAVDLSGRSCLRYLCDIKANKVGDFDTELSEEFWLAFVRNSDMTLHIKKIDGENAHHIIEGTFKSVGHSLGIACKIDEKYKDDIPSTKGVLR